MSKWLSNAASGIKGATHAIAERMGKVDVTSDEEVATLVKGLTQTETDYKNLRTALQGMSKQNKETWKAHEKFTEFWAGIGDKIPQAKAVSQVQSKVEDQRAEFQRSLESFIEAIETFLDNDIKLAIAFSKEQDKARSEYDKYRVRLAEFEGKPDKADKYNETKSKVEAAEAKYQESTGELKTKLYALEEHRQRHLSEKLSELMQAQKKFFLHGSTELQTLA